MMYYNIVQYITILEYYNYTLLLKYTMASIPHQNQRKTVAINDCLEKTVSI